MLGSNNDRIILVFMDLNFGLCSSYFSKLIQKAHFHQDLSDVLAICAIQSAHLLASSLTMLTLLLLNEHLSLLTCFRSGCSLG